MCVVQNANSSSIREEEEAEDDDIILVAHYTANRDEHIQWKTEVKTEVNDNGKRRASSPVLPNRSKKQVSISKFSGDVPLLIVDIAAR